MIDCSERVSDTFIKISRTITNGKPVIEYVADIDNAVYERSYDNSSKLDDAVIPFTVYKDNYIPYKLRWRNSDRREFVVCKKTGCALYGTAYGGGIFAAMPGNVYSIRCSDFTKILLLGPNDDGVYQQYDISRYDLETNQFMFIELDDDKLGNEFMMALGKILSKSNLFYNKMASYSSNDFCTGKIVVSLSENNEVIKAVISEYDAECLPEKDQWDMIDVMYAAKDVADHIVYDGSKWFFQEFYKYMYVAESTSRNTQLAALKKMLTREDDEHGNITVKYGDVVLLVVSELFKDDMSYSYQINELTMECGESLPTYTKCIRSNVVDDANIAKLICEAMCICDKVHKPYGYAFICKSCMINKRSFAMGDVYELYKSGIDYEGGFIGTINGEYITEDSIAALPICIIIGINTDLDGAKKLANKIFGFPFKED